MCSENETKVEVGWAWLGLAARMCWDALCSFHGVSLPSSAQLLTEGCSYSGFLAWCMCGHSPCPLQHPSAALSSAWCSQWSGLCSMPLQFLPELLLWEEVNPGQWGEGESGGAEGVNCHIMVTDSCRGREGCSISDVCTPWLCAFPSVLTERLQGIGSCGLATFWWKYCEFWSNLSFKVYFFLSMKVSENY